MWICGHDAEAKGTSFLSYALRDCAESYQPQGHGGESRRQLRVDSPTAMGDSIVILRNASDQREHHSHRVVRYFFQTIRRYICNPNFTFSSGVEVNTIDTNAITHYTFESG